MRASASEEEFLEKLSAVGVFKSSISELVNGPSDYDAALPLILEHVGGVRCLDERRTAGSREMLIRSLAVPAAKRLPALWETLKPLFEAAPDVEEKWAIGNTMRVAAAPSRLKDVVDFLSRPALEKAREPFCRAARKLGAPELIPPLVAILREKRRKGEDPRFPYETQITPADPIAALGWIGGLDVVSRIEPFLKDCYPGTSIPDPLVRKAAKAAIERIRKRHRENR